MAAGTRAEELRRFPGFRGIAWLGVVFLYAPILVIAVYSFNSIRSITVWGSFTLDWYGRVFRNSDIQQATLNSLTVAPIAASIATVIRLRSRLESPGRSQISAKSTSSVSSANLGAISPNASLAFGVLVTVTTFRP